MSARRHGGGGIYRATGEHTGAAQNSETGTSTKKIPFFLAHTLGARLTFQRRPR